ncbi:hypothetical protein M413DRAFT_26599 [Hebeloma cylindrosporum]|uniref:F-box domain-containing protein n=1 Tax=Hebeloma cylindrosporum TaxID=76867 RepID=A0A0C3CEB8_HEBCY|nr:hypothetical protein M413DRAFT_26599 [Hebeloma cylindrosporum h7]
MAAEAKQLHDCKWEPDHIAMLQVGFFERIILRSNVHSETDDLKTINIYQVSLPVEIFSEIIQNLDDLLDKSTIHSLSRCCLLLAPLCQRRIFHTIKLDSSHKAYVKMVRLDESFIRSPHLATYVHSFEIYLRDERYDLPHPRSFRILSKISSVLTHLQILKMVGADIVVENGWFANSYFDWTLITESLDPDKQDTGIAVEKLLVGERLRHLEVGGVLNFPFTTFLRRCQVVDLVDDRPHTIAIRALEMFGDASYSSSITSVQSYTLSRTDRKFTSRSLKQDQDPPTRLQLNFTKLSTLTVTCNTDRDIRETESLILLGRSIETLSITGEQNVCFREHALTAVEVHPQLKFTGLAKLLSSTSPQTVKSLHLQNLRQARPRLRDKSDDPFSSLSTQFEIVDLRDHSLEQLSITLYTGADPLMLDRGGLERLDNAISRHFGPLKRVTVKLCIYIKHIGYYPCLWVPGVDEGYRGRMPALCRMHGPEFILTHENEKVNRSFE